MAKPITSAEQKGALNRAAVLSQQIEAMIQVTYGEGGESFRSMADHLQDMYMWAVADLMAELKDCIDKLPCPKTQDRQAASHGA
jgi:hypothetical protein